MTVIRYIILFDIILYIYIHMLWEHVWFVNKKFMSGDLCLQCNTVYLKILLTVMHVANNALIFINYEESGWVTINSSYHCDAVL